MVNSRRGLHLKSLGVLWDFGTFSGLDDRELLARFVDRRDASSELAFEVLILRHGPMVLGVSQALLGDRHAAEDVFQAVFLILARKARSIRKPEQLGPWLHGVTWKTAHESRKREHRRLKLAEQVAKLPTTLSLPPESRLIQSEGAEALHGEIARLPERYRTVIVLCDLEGLTQQEAASRLRCPVGTVAVRLKRAKERLRVSLTSRGLAPSASLIPLLARPEIAPRLLASAVKSSMASGFATASVVSLAEGVRMTMIFANGKTATVGLVLTLGLATTWAASGGFARAQKGNDPPPVVERVVERAITRPIRDCEEFTGVTEFLRKEAVRSRLGGLLEKVHTESGRRVKANDVLFEFDSKPYEATLKLAQAEVQKAEAQEKLAKAVEKRNARLRERDSRFVSQEDFDKGVAELLLRTEELHVARQNETQATVDLAATKVRARFDGMVVARTAVAKNYYDPENPLAWIATTDPMVVEFKVSEQAILRLLRMYGREKKALEDMEFDIKGNFENGPPHPLTVESFPLQFDPATGTGKFRGTFVNPPESNFRAGMLVRVRLWSGPPREAVLIPEAAILADGGHQFVYVVNDKDVVDRREVQLELNHDGLHEVRAGLKAGDRVVVEGLADLKPGMTIKPKVAAKPDR